MGWFLNEGCTGFKWVNLVLSFIVNLEDVPNKNIAHLNKVLRDRASFSFQNSFKPVVINFMNKCDDVTFYKR